MSSFPSNRSAPHASLPKHVHFFIIGLFGLFIFLGSSSLFIETAVAQPQLLSTTAVNCADSPWIVATESDLNEAIACSNAELAGNYTISMTSNISLTAATTAINNAISVTLEIAGNGYTLDGANAYRLLDINNGDVTIDSLTLTNGYASSLGGAIQNSGSLTLTQSTLISNSVRTYGGGIYNYGALTILQSTLADNEAGSAGGGIYNNNGNITIENSTMSGHSVGSYGGFMYLYRGSAVLNHTTLSGNSANRGSGFVKYNGSVTINNSIITNSSGDVCWRISGSGFNGSNNLIDGSCAGKIGSVTNFNDALDDNGGATETHALFRGSNAMDAVTCTVSEDQRGVARPSGASCDIGAFEYEYCPQTAWAVNNEATLNEAIACYNDAYEGHYTVSMADDVSLTAATTTINNSISATLEIAGNGYTLDGANAYRLLDINNGDVTIDSLTLTNGYASSLGGAIQNSGSLTLTQSTLISNSVRTYGGGIYNYGALTILQSTLADNEAGSAGGGIYNNNGNITIENSTMSGHSVGSYGGFMYLYRGSALLNHTTLSGNSANRGSGFVKYNGSVTINNSIITNSSGDVCWRISGSGFNGSNNLIDGSCAGRIGSVTNFNDALDDNGGATETHALLNGSNAIDAVACTISEDQRGVARPDGGNCDIGAFEGALYQLNTAVSGAGSGNINLTPTGADCGTSCTAAFDYGTAVTLTAVADTGSTFVGWTGACTGSSDCAVTITETTNVTATFDLIPYDLTVTVAGTGNGSVSSAPSGIDCGADCAETFDYGTAITLTAVAETGSTFAGWTGACSGSGDCALTITETTNVTATFDLTPYDLAVTVVGTGNGSVSSIPSGIDCGADCAETFDYGTAVTLTAVAETGSTFAGWTGACSGSGDCALTITQTTNVTATFDLISYDLAVSVVGAGNGSVSSAPSGIDCGADCAETFDYGTAVTLTAVAETGSTFAGWTGACAGSGDCVVTITETTNVTATFDIATFFVYLPMIANGTVSAPDLVVTDVQANADGVIVTIENQGNAPTDNYFWVDFYVNPNPVPSRVNQLWSDVADQGVVWGVQQQLQVGESLTLMYSNDPAALNQYYFAQYSHFSGVAAGVPIYAQVDSANNRSQTGGVLETHELIGAAYNNVSEMFVSVASLLEFPQTGGLKINEQQSSLPKR